MQRHLTAIFTIALAAATAVGPAMAQATPETAQTQPLQPAVTGTVPLPQDAHTEGAEGVALQSIAKVDLQTAVAVARKALGVTDSPSSAQLGDENGFLVWEVVIGNQAIKVDAGDGSILATETVGAPRPVEKDNEVGITGGEQTGGEQTGAENTEDGRELGATAGSQPTGQSDNEQMGAEDGEDAPQVGQNVGQSAGGQED